MQFISDPFTDKTRPLFDIFGFGRFLCDRKNPENTKKWPYKFTIRDDCRMPSELTTLSFEEICMKKLNEIKHMNRDNWVVLWSGGIDSSLVLRLLLEHEKDFNFSVMLSDASIQTFPEMYNELLKRGINLLPTSKYLEIANEVSYLAGAGADPLTYQFANWYERGINPDMSIDNFYTAYSKIKKNKSLAKFQIDLILDSCPYELEYFCDLAWWYSFNFGWQSTSLGHNIMLQDNNTHYKRKIEAFFTGDLFERWSLSTYKSRRIDNHRDIKAPFKRFIYALGDKNYADRIIKTRSNVLALGMNKSPRDIDANGKLL